MAHKMLRFDARARRSMEKGVNKLADAVKVTLGPKGQYAILQNPPAAPTVTNDGVTIAEEIHPEDIFENQHQLAKEVATRTNDVAGDGTTTALVLAQSIVREGVENVAAGANPVILRGGIDRAIEVAVEAIKAQAREISGRDEVARVGAISARSREIGDIIAEALEKVGKDGVVNVEDSQTFGMDLEFTEGMHFDKGFVSPQLVTDQARMETILEDPLILIVNQKISAARDLLPVLNEAMRSGKPLLVISDDIEGEALAALVVNKAHGKLDAVAVRAPLFGDRRKRMLEDIAILTGGEAIIGELGLRLENIRPEQLGSSRKAVVTKDATTIVGGAGDPGQIQDRLDRIGAELKVTSSDYDRQKLQERSAKLAGVAATIKVGATTETEIRETKHRVEDALSATRAALEEGIVPGGGIALLHAQGPVADLVDTLDDDERTGASIVRRALEEPLRQISANAGADGSIVVDNIRNRGGSSGFNALTGEYEDLVAAGIVDPAMVTRSALQNAASIGSLLITADVVIAEPAEGLGAAAVMRAGMNMDVV